jgi:hypothetical protein
MYALLLDPCFTASAASRKAINDNAARWQKVVAARKLVAEIAQDNHARCHPAKGPPADLDQALDHWLLCKQAERALLAV